MQPRRVKGSNVKPPVTDATEAENPLAMSTVTLGVERQSLLGHVHDCASCVLCKARALGLLHILRITLSRDHRAEQAVLAHRRARTSEESTLKNFY